MHMPFQQQVQTDLAKGPAEASLRASLGRSSSGLQFQEEAGLAASIDRSSSRK
jgi:hypothetical protein